MKKESSNSAENKDNTGKVGYGKPPVEHQFKPGQSGNPGGRPKNTLKDYVRHKFMAMTDEEKEAFLKKVSPDIIWKMGEGNPDTALTGADGKDLIPATEEREKLKKTAHDTLRRL